MPRKINSFCLTLISLCLVLMSCDSKAVFDQYRSVPNKWHKDSLLSFSFQAPDTVNHYKLYINLRNTDEYKYSNLFLLAELNYPNGKTVIDTLEYKMAKPSGELLGKGFTDIKENKLWYKGYKKPFNFEELGEYTFSIQHAMRKSGEVKGILELKGITDVGFRVENN